MKVKLDESKLAVLENSLKELCESCNFIDQLCENCTISDSMSKLEVFKTDSSKFEALIQYDLELVFEKNKILLLQNAIEELCSTCDSIGVFCRECDIHAIRKNVAMLPLKEGKSFLKPKSKNAEKKDSGGCGTSCSTSCGTKKKTA